MFGETSVPFWTAVAALSACATIVVTCIFSFLTIKLMREQSAPKVIAFLRHNPERQSLIYIVVRNVGTDLAQNVTFTPSRPIPVEAFGFTGTAKKATKVMTQGPLVGGIPALGPGEERVMLWGQYGGIELALNDGPIFLRFSYRQEKRTFYGDAELELASFANTDASEAHIAVAVRHLDSISKSLGKIASTQRQLSHPLTGNP